MKYRVISMILIGAMLCFSMGGVAESINGTERTVKTMKTRAGSTLTSMKLSGYLDEMVNGNIGNWALTALEENPNIIEQIENATADGATLGSLLSDPFAQVSGGILSVTMAARKGYNGSDAFAVTSKKAGSYADMDYKIAQLPGTRLDWRGAEEVWFYVDASAYSEQSTNIGFAIQEKNTNASGALTNNYESWGIRSGVTLHLYDERKGVWEQSTAVTSSSTTWNAGRVAVPAGFKGWVAIPLNNSCMNAYWASAGYNNTLDLADVNQFQICVEGDNSSVGNTIYLSAFSIVGKGFAGALPVGGRLDGATFTRVVPLEDILPGGNSYTGTVVPWYTEFPGKLLTGIAYNYLLSPTAELKTAGDRLADAFRNAQAKDGYIGVYKGNDILGGNGTNWDVWGHYHGIYGLLYWYRVAGDADALETAKKAADKVYTYFIGSNRTFDSAGSQTMNLGVSHAFAELYKETGDKRYLEAAVQIVEEEWPRSGDWMNAALKGKEFYQTALPRWEALHTVLTLGTLWELTGTEKYYTALENIWWSIAKTDRHNTGGFSSGETACGDPYATGAIETCCTVAWMALSTEYLQLSRNSVVADELELSYYNAMLGSLLDGEKYVTYNTPMEGGVRVSSQVDIAFQYNSGSPAFNCCQANVSRGLGELSQWAVLTDNNTMYVNFYGETAMAVKTPGGQSVTLSQETTYPLDGAVTITLNGLNKSENFALALRIPTWAEKSTVTVDGRTVQVNSGRYYTIERDWKNGDTVVLNIGMAFHTWVNENYTEEGSLYYGPILLGTDSTELLVEAVISWEDLTNAKVAVAKDGKHWLTATVTADGEKYTLYDFASIGKFSRYYTWISVEGLPESISAAKGELPIWCNEVKTADNGGENSGTTTNPTTNRGEATVGSGSVLNSDTTLSADTVSTSDSSTSSSFDTDPTGAGDTTSPINTDPAKDGGIGWIVALIGGVLALAAALVVWLIMGKRKKPAADI